MKQGVLLRIIADQLAAIQTLATELEFVKSMITEIPVLSQHYAAATKHQPFSPVLREVEALRLRVETLIDSSE
jgi:hypothetical protein